MTIGVSIILSIPYRSGGCFVACPRSLGINDETAVELLERRSHPECVDVATKMMEDAAERLRVCLPAGHA